MGASIVGQRHGKEKDHEKRRKIEDEEEKYEELMQMFDDRRQAEHWIS